MSHGGVASSRASHSARHSVADVITALLAANVDPNSELRMHRPTRGGYTGRFSEPLLDLGATPLLRATMANDMDVIQALLAKGASPNINAMGVTPFLVAAGAGGGGQRGGGPGAQRGEQAFALLDLYLQHGADVNAQVTGTQTYSIMSYTGTANVPDGTISGWNLLSSVRGIRYTRPSFVSRR